MFTIEQAPKRANHLHRPADSSSRPLRRAVAVVAASAIAVAFGVAAGSPASAASASPDFGPNVTIFDPSMSVTDINAALQAASHESEFSTNRHAFLFKPGTYGSAAGQNDPATATGVINSEVGYYMTVAGLGSSPDDVLINGAIHSEGHAPLSGCPFDNGEGDSALNNFWRSMSNLAINPIQQAVPGDVGVSTDCYPPARFPEGTADAHQLRWAVSQAAPLRRVHVEGTLSVFPKYGGFSSGGYLADSVVDGSVTTGSQQQWFARDSTVDSWSDPVWNTVLAGVQGAPANTFPTPPTTTLDSTDISRDPPFLRVDGSGNYSVFVPNVRTDGSGTDWGTTTSDGRSIPIADFYIAHAGDSAATINAALDSGKNLIVTPGIYNLSESLRVTDPNTVVLGLGMATLVPTNGNSAITVDDVSGVQVSGITIDAGAISSPTLVKIGQDDANASHLNDPTTFTDVFVRVGGPHAGKADTSIEVNSNNVILDDIWAWRADHGTGVGWDQNTANTGVRVNGDDVTALGLFVEHYQKNQVVWNGNGGSTTFYQSELPYDVPNQAAWMDGSRNGYASYRVSDTVTSHRAVGLGVYSFFNQNQDIVEDSGVQAPKATGVTFESLTSVFLNGSGNIKHIINDQGAPAVLGDNVQHLTAYAPVDTTNPVAAINPSKTAPDGTNGWYRGLTINPGGTDDFAIAPTAQYRIDGSEWKVATGPVVLGDGTHTVEVRATDGAGNTSAVVSQSFAVDASAPIVRASVSNGGTAQASVSLSATDGTSGIIQIEYAIGSGAWTPYSSPVPIPTGVQSVSFRATDGAGNVSAAGSVAATGLTITPSVVTITGKAKIGSTLKARSSSWGTATVSLNYRWLNGGKAIKGATKSSYRLTSADKGDRISVRVTATAAGLPSTSVTSSSVKVYRALATTPQPKLHGTARVGRTLTVTAGTWKPSHVHLTYRWYRDGLPIRGATGKTHKLVIADRGSKVTVAVTGARSGYLTESRASSSVKVR